MGMTDLKQKLEAAARREAGKQISEYVDMGLFRDTEEASKYLVEGFIFGDRRWHPQIIKLVEALEECSFPYLAANNFDHELFRRMEIAKQALAEFHAALEKV